MKKSILLSVLFLCLSMALFAQSSNNEQRLVGTWINNADGSKVVFNSDGTMSGSFESKDCIKYAVASEKIALMYSMNRDFNPSLCHTIGCEFRISSDGRTLIIITNWNGLNTYSFKRQ